MGDKSTYVYHDFALSGRPDARLKWFADNGFRYDYVTHCWTCHAMVRKAGNKCRSRVDVVIYEFCVGTWVATCRERGMLMPGPTSAEGETPQLAFARLSRKMNGDEGTDNE